MYVDSSYNVPYSVYGSKLQHDDSKALYYDIGNGTGDIGLNISSIINDFKDSADTDPKNPASIIEEIQKALDAKRNAPSSFNIGDNAGWMNLFIDDAKNQRSNGLLLHADDYHYVHNQRYALDTLSNILADAKAMDVYEKDSPRIVPDYLKKNLILDGLNSEEAKPGHFFNITNANYALGEGLSAEDLLGLEKAILGVDAVNSNEADREEERKAKKSRKVKH